MTRVGIVALSLVLIAGSAQPAFLDGNALYEFCTSSNDLEQMQCLGYVMATADYVNLLRLYNHQPQCIPAEPSGRQVVDVVLNYLRARPQDRNLDGVFLVGAALSNAWGCYTPRSNP
jgi:hypothetical protein